MRDFAAVLQQADEDFEFSREMRYYTGKLHVTIGDQAWLAVYDDGRLLSADPSDIDPEDAAIAVSGTREQWEEMTAEHPRPFFQSLQSSSIKHGVRLSNTDQLYAYLPALNRLMQIFRQLNAQGA
ncbi:MULTISPECIES: hypothetical protein [Streptomyces]|uniref:SCP2 domain-containing protein n=2 Tax=Streptomyces TaxID=1883 RepID=A0ABU4MT17_9ACTN|nr:MULTISPECIES: hypothetical protein [Streptomyces]KUN81315.1 hypothetical protein AQJ64_23275 [Streptomyces griseoruber]MBE4737610.1 hypothetical protein [Streptomyces caniscabiei]MBE4756370.1 hypothetical protein [Streptomyces caniscabiei]MBE4769614.1 hypothetical protein [Streptomyces caniscabiei]MBE4787441.1 hypothetical protein [Streptomyces caniscabiei]